jgi:GNAT superfamily N-acetyltransferase
MAEYERLPLLIAEQTMARDGFTTPPKFRALIADWNGEPAGYAVFFDCYSTFQGCGLFLEDLFVRPQFRKNKVGRALLSQVAKIAQQEDCFGIMLHVLNWNEMAIQFYKKLDATFLDDWKTVCIKGDALQNLTKAAPGL